MIAKRLLTTLGLSLTLLAGLGLFIGLNTESAAARPVQQLDYSACAHYDDFPPSNDPNRRGGRKSECKALIDLYNATNGANWINNGSRGGGWGQGSYAFWNGVSHFGGFIPPGNLPLSAFLQVRELRLKNNNLVNNNSLPNGLGLPESIGDLYWIEKLELQDNKDLIGTLPMSLTKLQYLEHFYYDGTGLCPPEDDLNTTTNEADDFKNWLLTIPNRRINENCDLELMGLEVTQAVQTLENSVPLIAGKITYVRAYVKSQNGKDQDNIRGELTLISGGKQKTLKQTITVKSDPKREKLKDSFYFQVPTDWLTGTVTFQFKAFRGSSKLTVDCKEPAENPPAGAFGTKDDCEVTLPFEAMPPLPVRFSYVNWRDETGVWRYPQLKDMGEAKITLRRKLPISKIEGLPLPRVIEKTFDIANFPSRLELLDFVVTWIELGRPLFKNNNHIYYGLLIDGTPGDYNRSSLGIGYYPPQSSAAGINPSIAPHEVGHTLGGHHIKCRTPIPSGPYEPSQPTDPNGSYLYGYISKQQSEWNEKTVYGLDVYQLAQGNANGVVRKPNSCDLMSYGSPNWISDKYYKLIKAAIEARFGDVSSNAAISTQAVTDVMLITGVVTPTISQGKIDAIINTSTQASVPTPTPGSYAVLFENSGGQTLASYNFEPTSLSNNEFEKVFYLVLPRDPNTHRIVLLHNGVELDSRTASANPPTVTVTSPNGGETLSGSTATLSWTANDPDGDPLSYVVQYSADAGATWETLTTNWLTTSLTLDLDFISGSNQALIRVLANDGFHTGQDQSDGVFSTPIHPPTSLIYLPGDGDLFKEGQTISLDGDAFDYEDGQIPAANLTWSSNLDGNLGTGESLSVEATLLSAGVHTITLTAQDSDGMSGADSVSITIEKPKTVTYTVNTTSDVIDANVGDGLCDSDAVAAGEQCSLRAAIQEANAANNHSLINLQPGIYYLTLDGVNTEDQAADGDLDIALNPDMRLTIAGPGQAIIDARYTSGRVFQILGSTVVISGVTIQRGTAESNSGYDWGTCCGGGIMFGERNGIDSDVTLVNTKLTNNSSTNRGGGGAVYYIAGKLTVLNSEIFGNASAGNGAGIYAIPHSGGDIDLTIIDSIFSNNSTGCTPFGCGGSGGGLYFHSGDLVISSTTFTANTATGSGGGLYHGNSGDLRISGSIFSRNTADGQGGGMQVGSRAYGTVVVEDTLITHNTASGSGGGIYGGPLVLNSVVSYNQGQNGGGIYGGPTLVNSQVISNSAVGDNDPDTYDGNGGGILGDGCNAELLIDSIVSHNSATGAGGGIGGGFAKLTNSEISHNSALSGGGVSVGTCFEPAINNSLISYNTASERGGGIYIPYAAGSPYGHDIPYLTVINSTISHNTANIGGGFDDSGGISITGRFSYIGVFSNTTVSNNTATSQSGGIHHEQGTLTLENTLLANNSGGDCGGDSGGFYSDGHNLASDATCLTLTQTGDLTGTNPLLGPLQDNGGSTLTHAIPQGSPAEDAGNNASCPTTDQRGYTRYNDNGCDIGAYEYMPEGAVLWVNPYRLSFQIPANNTAPISQTIGIGNPEELSARWTANESIPWLNLALASGQMPAALDVIIDSTGLSEGVYTGSITIASADLQGSPQTVDVELIVGKPNTSPPSGSNFVYLPIIIK